ncbi:MarR family transcriptional regulator, partial [Isoptericola sp. NPDC056134]|uniref:MarR family transcriptional regulator n=1 Tax=Isoptericola sp. NPDC056134 TaxID=3345723 RepID=UPI0035E48D6E
MIPTTDEPAASSGDAPGNAGPDDERRALLDELVRIHHAIGETFLSQRLEPLLHTRLTVQQLRALAILQLDGETSSHRLAEVMGVAPATVTGIVDRLVSAGMASRRPDPRDRRVRLVAATTRGADAVGGGGGPEARVPASPGGKRDSPTPPPRLTPPLSSFPLPLFP